MSRGDTKKHSSSWSHVNKGDDDEGGESNNETEMLLKSRSKSRCPVGPPSPMVANFSEGRQVEGGREGVRDGCWADEGSMRV
jgi:hypothetical protein